MDNDDARRAFYKISKENSKSDYIIRAINAYSENSEYISVDQMKTSIREVLLEFEALKFEPKVEKKIEQIDKEIELVKNSISKHSTKNKYRG